MAKDRKRILVVEDALGVAKMYEAILSEEYDVTVYNSGSETKKAINNGQVFDLAIMDLVLPPEELYYTLADSQRTGIRLLEYMIKCGACARFYILTAIKRYKQDVEQICKKANAVFQFQYKLDSEPEELSNNVKNLISLRI